MTHIMTSIVFTLQTNLMSEYLKHSLQIDKYFSEFSTLNCWTSHEAHCWQSIPNAPMNSSLANIIPSIDLVQCQFYGTQNRLSCLLLWSNLLSILPWKETTGSMSLVCWKFKLRNTILGWIMLIVSFDMKTLWKWTKIEKTSTHHASWNLTPWIYDWVEWETFGQLIK